MKEDLEKPKIVQVQVGQVWRRKEDIPGSFDTDRQIIAMGNGIIVLGGLKSSLKESLSSLGTCYRIIRNADGSLVE